MPEYCPPLYVCNTYYPGWLHGGHPSVEDGIVQRHICFRWSFYCCYWYFGILVRNCTTFFVYQPSPSSLRYCSRLCVGKLSRFNQQSNKYSRQPKILIFLSGSENKVVHQGIFPIADGISSTACVAGVLVERERYDPLLVPSSQFLRGNAGRLQRREISGNRVIQTILFTILFSKT